MFASPIKFLLWRQLYGCSVTRPFLSAKGVACETRWLLLSYMSTYEFWCIGTLLLKSLLNTLAWLKKTCRTVGCGPCQASSSQCQSMQSTTVMQSQHEALFWCIGTLVNLYWIHQPGLRRAAEQFTWLWALPSKQLLMSKYNNRSKPAWSVNEIM